MSSKPSHISVTLQRRGPLVWEWILFYNGKVVSESYKIHWFRWSAKISAKKEVAWWIQNIITVAWHE